MKKQILFFAAAGLIGQAIYTFNPTETIEKPLPFATHSLLIFIDDSEEEIAAIAANLMVALSQKAAPILASTSLFTTIENNPTLSDLIKQDQDNEDYKVIETRYKEVTKRIPELIESLPNQEDVVAELNKEFPPITYGNKKISNALKRQGLSFKPDDWIIKIVDHKQRRLLLLIPKNYTPTGDTSVNLKNYTALPEPLTYNPSLTMIEYQLGLKIDHMETIQNYTDAITKKFQPKKSDYFMQAVWPTWPKQSIANCSDIFVSNAEYAQAKKQSPRWLIYASGHGHVKEQSIGLTLDMFKRLLDFMNSKIHTSIFVYVTCFAVGTNIQQIYQDERQLPKTYSFIIITQGVTDSVTMTLSGFTTSNFRVADIDFTNKTLQMGPAVNYVQFIKNFTSTPEITDFESAIAPIMSSQLKASTLEVPHIRLKGGEFFNIADITNKIASIGNIFAKTCTQVDLANYFTKKGVVPEYYLVYAPNIPCELIISSAPEVAPYFIPMFIPQASDSAIFEYHIKQITAPNLSLDDVIGMFINGIPAGNSIRIRIDQVNAQADALFQTKENEVVSFKEVIIELKNNAAIELSQLLEKHTKLLAEHNRLVGMQKFDQAEEVMHEVEKVGSEIAQAENRSREASDIFIDCYFMYHNMPYEIGEQDEPARPLQEDYRNKFKKPEAKLERFENIRELHKKHILLQKLKKSPIHEVAH